MTIREQGFGQSEIGFFTASLRQLLQNHAGWMIDRNNDPMFERSPPCPNSAARWLSAQKLQADPGQLYSYSNLNFCLAQLAIEKASGQKYTDFVQAQIAAPAGIKSWEFATLRGKADEQSTPQTALTESALISI